MQLVDVLVLLAVAVPSVILHEVSHGWAALRLGDDTAKRRGRLIAIAVLAALCAAGGGLWAARSSSENGKPAAPAASATPEANGTAVAKPVESAPSPAPALAPTPNDSAAALAGTPAGPTATEPPAKPKVAFTPPSKAALKKPETKKSEPAAPPPPKPGGGGITDFGGRR